MQNKPSNGKGPGLAGFAAMISGMVCFFWLAHSPQAWPVVLIQRLAASQGQHLPAIAGIVLGSGLAALAVWVPLLIFTDPAASARKKQAVKAAKVAMDTDAERARLEREQRSFRDSSSMVHDFSGEKAKAKQATPGFVFMLIGAGVAVLALAQFILTHFR